MRRLLMVFTIGMFCGSVAWSQPVAYQRANGKPDALINLATVEGMKLVQGQWKYHDARIVEVDHRSPGPDFKPSGVPNKTNSIEPQAGAKDFDDSAWEVITPVSLYQRRSTGRLCFNWYRVKFTIPEAVGTVKTAGATIHFEVVVDDYAEVWVDGQLQRILGQSGGGFVKGFNAPNRVLLTTDARPGQQFQLAILGINGPLSEPPPNFIWIKSATLDIHQPRPDALLSTGWQVKRVDPGLDQIVPHQLRVEKVASGFGFTEGPVWTPEGTLLFSDPNNNTIYRYAPESELSIFRVKSGYDGSDIGRYGQPGSNGLTLDPEGRLVFCQHGHRRVVRLEKNGNLTVLADRCEGKRLNSPNDLVFRSDGTLFFTDPPFGLPRFFDDPGKETPYSGVYCVHQGQVKLISTDLTGPNGIAFSPDEKHLYVGNWDDKKKIVMRYEVANDGSLSKGMVFRDMTSASGADAIDGIKVDKQGHVYVSGPGGLWILSPEGKHLGTISGPEQPHNLAWGGDGSTLYLTAEKSVYRMKLLSSGIRPEPAAMTSARK